MKYFLLSLLIVLPINSASAATLRANDDLSISIPINDDLYAAGGSVSIRENVTGDLLIIGGDISINGDISQDIIVLGGDIALQGTVGDDLRAVGGNIAMSGSVGDDFIAMGGKIFVMTEAQIFGDLKIFGGDIIMDGTTKGDLFIRGGSVRVTGKIDGNVDIQAESLIFDATVGGNARLASRNFKMEDSTIILGNLNYWNPDSSNTFENAKIDGEITFDSTMAMKDLETNPKTIGAFLLGMFGYTLIASALIMLIAILITKSYFKDAAIRLNKAPGISIWYGLIYVIVTPVLALLFCLTVIGIPIGLLLIIMYLITFFFIKSLTSVLFAKWLEIHFHKKWGTVMLLSVSIAVLFVWKIIIFIPFVGVLASAVAVLAGFGTLSHIEWEKWKKVR